MLLVLAGAPDAERRTVDRPTERMTDGGGARSVLPALPSRAPLPSMRRPGGRRPVTRTLVDVTPLVSGRQRAFSIGAFVWAGTGCLIALASLPDVGADARPLVAAAGVVFPACAVVSGVAARRGRWRGAGLALALSAATPTFFFWVPNAVALVVGVVLAIRPPRLHDGSVA